MKSSLEVEWSVEGENVSLVSNEQEIANKHGAG